MAAVDLFFWITGLTLILTVAYLCFLAVQSLLPAREPTVQKKPSTRFAIVIPAHDEAMVIRSTLDSIEEVDYPRDLYEPIVIADNCEDETAQVVARYRAVCLQRHDDDRIGKGFALQWAFERLREEARFDGYDAFVIMDADTVMGPDFLKVMDRRIAGGEKAIQGYYDVIGPERSAMASLSYLGFALSRHLKYKGRTRMGWSSNLLGNGMCFTRQVIERFGWNATSIVEDLEYAIMLHLGGIRVTFAPEARVFAEIPETFKYSKIQRSRWDIGRFQLRNRYLPRLVKKALTRKDVSYLDTAMELLIPPFALFLVLSFALFALFLVISSHSSKMLSVIWFVDILALGIYVLAGLVVARASWRVYANLIYAPFFIIWRLTTIVWGYLSSAHRHWIKTERKEGGA